MYKRLSILILSVLGFIFIPYYEGYYIYPIIGETKGAGNILYHWILGLVNSTIILMGLTAGALLMFCVGMAIKDFYYTVAKWVKNGQLPAGYTKNWLLYFLIILAYCFLLIICHTNY